MIAPEVTTPVLREVEKRLVLDAVVLKKLVVVALVVVELPVTIKSLPSVTTPFAFIDNAVAVEVAKVEAEDVAR